MEVFFNREFLFDSFKGVLIFCKICTDFLDVFWNDSDIFVGCIFVNEKLIVIILVLI